MMTNKEICNFIKNKLKNREKLTNIVESFLDKSCATTTHSNFSKLGGKGCDNMSAILIVFK